MTFEITFKITAENQSELERELAVIRRLRLSASPEPRQQTLDFNQRRPATVVVAPAPAAVPPAPEKPIAPPIGDAKEAYLDQVWGRMSDSTQRTTRALMALREAGDDGIEAEALKRVYGKNLSGMGSAVGAALKHAGVRYEAKHVRDKTVTREARIWYAKEKINEGIAIVAELTPADVLAVLRRNPDPAKKAAEPKEMPPSPEGSQ